MPEIRLLGRLEVWHEGRGLELPRSRKARALLAYLVHSPQPRSREHLCDLLWDGPANPRAELRWCLAKIRPVLNTLAESCLLTEDDHVAFDSGKTAVDTERLRQLIPSVPDAASTAALEQAAQLVRGPFLDGMDLPDCYRFDAWCLAERQSWHQLHDSVLRSLVDRLRSQPETALRYARHRLLLDPLSEDAHADLILLLQALGQTAEARERYEHCRRMLKQELGQPPSARLEELRLQLVPSPAPTRRQATASSARPPAVALVGRRRECAAIQRAVASRTPLLVTGDPGIGKSRLLQETASAQTQRVKVLVGSAYEVDSGRPYAPWIDALRSVPATALPVPATLRPELAALLPELGAATTQSGDRNRLFEAVAQLLIAMADKARPVLIVLDDLQWFDEASIALLHYLVRATAAYPVAFVMATRSGELAGNRAAQRLVHTLLRDQALQVMEVDPLTAIDTRELASRVSPQADGDAVFRESEGNPLFALEIARSHRQGRPPLGGTLGELIAGRLANLDREAAEVLPWAAALGRRLTPDGLAAVMSLSPTALLKALEDLERRVILRVTDNGAYEFAHDVIRRAAYQTLSEPRRRLIHLQIARSLSRGGALREQHAGEVAYHAELGGDHRLAARACAMAGRYALRIHAYEEVATLAARGQTHLGPLPSDLRLQRAVELLELYIHPGMVSYRPSNLEHQLRELVNEARAAGLIAEEHHGLYLIGVLLYLRGHYGAALDVTEHAEHAGRAADPETVVRAIADTARCLGMLGQEMDRAAKLVQEAQTLAEQLEVREHGCEMPLAIALVRHHRGDLEAARSHAQQALALARRDRTPWWEYFCLSRLPMIELERQAPEAALEWCRALLAVAGKLGAGAEAPFARALEALARQQRGEPDAVHAVHAVDTALAQLEAADSQWMIAYVQNMAAWADWEAGRPEAARHRAESALQSAESIGQRSEIALARAMLARTALALGDDVAASTQLSRAPEDDRQLSARARRALDGIRQGPKTTS